MRKLCENNDAKQCKQKQALLEEEEQQRYKREESVVLQYLMRPLF